MLNLLNIISNHIAKRNLSFDSDSLINLLDIGCSSFIPPHFVKYARVINLIGCDPDLIGIKKLRKKTYIKNFNSTLFLNIGASENSEKSYIEIANKRTGSKITKKKINNKTLDINLIKTSILQKKFNKGYANLIKIDAEGHELKVIKGMNLRSNSLLGVEVECTLDEGNNNLSDIISLFEKNNFFLASIRYHNFQTFNSSNFKNPFLKFFYKLLLKVPIIKNFNYQWTDLSGKNCFSNNKSFLNQIELLFLKKKGFINTKHFKKYKNILLIYGFARYFENLKASKLNKFILNNFPSR